MANVQRAVGVWPGGAHENRLTVFGHRQAQRSTSSRAGMLARMQPTYVATSRLRTHCWVQGPEGGEPVLLVHGSLSTGRFWKACADQLPGWCRVVAPDLRSFGRTEKKGIDATRGLRDWSDDLRALIEALGWADQRRIHAAGWSMGGGILQQYELDHGGDLASLTLVAPLSPYGFGGTRDAQGTPTHS